MIMTATITAFQNAFSLHYMTFVFAYCSTIQIIAQRDNCCYYLYMYIQGFYRSGKTGKSQGIWVVRERSGENIFVKIRKKSRKMRNWCHQMSDF